MVTGLCHENCLVGGVKHDTPNSVERLAGPRNDFHSLLFCKADIHEVALDCSDNAFLVQIIHTKSSDSTFMLNAEDLLTVDWREHSCTVESVLYDLPFACDKDYGLVLD